MIEPTSSSRDRLIGTWRLADWARVDADGTRTPPLPGAKGLIAYTADGFMFATLMGANRAPFAGTDPMGGTAEEAHRAMSSGLSYCGRWRMEGDRLVHAVELSMFPNWVGAEMTRVVRFDGDRAVVTTLPITDKGKTFVFELVLTRAR
jgi:hypothetical protein